MNEEIKEILSKDNIHIVECDKNWCNAYGYEKSQMKRDVIKYITILEEENKSLNNIIHEIKEYIMSNLITEWAIKNDGYVSGSDLPADAITPILDIIDRRYSEETRRCILGNTICN